MKKALILILSIIIAVSAILCATACGEKKSDFRFTVDEVKILAGDSIDLPAENTDGVVYSSSSPELAKVEDGRIVSSSDRVGLTIATVMLTATAPDGSKSTLIVKLYKDEEIFIKETEEIFVVFRVKTGTKWRVGDISGLYHEGDFISSPSGVVATDGYNAPVKWYRDRDMTETVDFSAEVMGDSSRFYYGEEILRDGSDAAGGAIDLNVARDSVLGVYVVIGLKYDTLPYTSIVIPETYVVDGVTVALRGIADNAFYYDRVSDGRRYNTGLQNLSSIDLTHIDYIGSNAFKNCLALKNVKMKATVNKAADAFNGTSTPYA